MWHFSLPMKRRLFCYEPKKIHLRLRQKRNQTLGNTKYDFSVAKRLLKSWWVFVCFRRLRWSRCRCCLRYRRIRKHRERQLRESYRLRGWCDWETRHWDRKSKFGATFTSGFCDQNWPQIFPDSQWLRDVLIEINSTTYLATFHLKTDKLSLLSSWKFAYFWWRWR